VTFAPADQEYSLRSHIIPEKDSDLTLLLSFSGGGTRAAALAYGVMLELRDTTVFVEGKSGRLLDHVTTISSVSGGSFTSAYYGLYGDGLFESFEDNFLRKDVQGTLIKSVLNPFHWFGRKGRTERTIEYYQKNIFHDATFSDLQKPGRPLIVINASDLASGVRFSFLQEYFDFLCSDLGSFPIANAVAASSAVPVVFNPVVVENYHGCEKQHPEWLNRVERRSQEPGNAELKILVEGLKSYADKDLRKYVHFVDGGITDNIGLRALYDVISLAGGAQSYVSVMKRSIPSKVIIIAIDASTEPTVTFDETNKQPSIAETIDSASSIGLHRYNAATLALVENAVHAWSDQLSTPEFPVTPYFIQVSFDGIKQAEARQFFRKVPTSFKLTDEQVDRLIQAGRELLRDNPVFQKLVADLTP